MPAVAAAMVIAMWRCSGRRSARCGVHDAMRSYPPAVRAAQPMQLSQHFVTIVLHGRGHGARWTTVRRTPPLGRARTVRRECMTGSTT